MFGRDLAGRIAIVNHGRFEQIGAPEVLYETPATPFVADFLGRTVSFEGTIAKNHAGLWVEFADGAGRSAAADATAKNFTVGARVRVTTRPEDVEILVAGGLEANQLSAVVTQVSYLGDRFEYVVKAAAASFVLSTPKKQRYCTGETVRLALDPARIYIHPL